MAPRAEQLAGTDRRSPVGILGRIVGARSKPQIRRALWGYLFALPWILGLIIFWGGPILVSFYYSLTDYNLTGAPKFIGAGNYVRAFSADDLFWPSIGRTLLFTIAFVPTTIAGALALALLLNQQLKGTTFFRTIFFIPHLLPAVALAVMWSFLLQPRLGPINTFLRAIGIGDPPTWLTTRDWALRTVVLINVWSAVGGNTMLIFLAGLQGVPKDLYEASMIDGASEWNKFRHITLPMLSPTIFFNVVLVMIAALKVFTTAWVATQGGPSYATWFFVLHIYQEAFQYFRLGYASALAWMLAIALIVLTLIQTRLSRRWVYYEGN